MLPELQQVRLGALLLDGGARLRRRCRPLVLLSACFALAGCAAPGTVFLKDGVTWESYRADHKHCLEQAWGDRPVEPRNKDIPPWVYHAGGFTGGYLTAQSQSRWAGDCMVIKGYERRKLESDERSRLGDLQTDPERTEFLRALPPQK